MLNGDHGQNHSEREHGCLACDSEPEYEPGGDRCVVVLDGAEMKGECEHHQSRGHRIGGEEVRMGEKHWGCCPEGHRRDGGPCPEELPEAPEQGPHRDDDKCRNCGARNQQTDLARRLEKSRAEKYGISALGSQQVDRGFKACQHAQRDAKDPKRWGVVRVHCCIAFKKSFHASGEVQWLVVGRGVPAREPEQHGEQSEQCKGRCCAGPFCSETKESQAVTDKDGEPAHERILALYWSQPSRFARCDDMI